MDTSDVVYGRFDSMLDKLREVAISFLVMYPAMNVGDKNFFEDVAILPDMIEIDGWIREIDLKTAKEALRKEVAIRKRARE